MKLVTHRLNKLVWKRPVTLVGGGGGGGGRERRVEGRKRKVKVEIKPENYLEILLSVHARTSELIFWITGTEGREVLYM